MKASNEVVATRYKCVKNSEGNFDKEQRIVDKSFNNGEPTNVSRSYVEMHNEQFEYNGIYFEIDEEATELHVQKVAESQEVHVQARLVDEFNKSVTVNQVVKALTAKDETVKATKSTKGEKGKKASKELEPTEGDDQVDNEATEETESDENKANQ